MCIQASNEIWQYFSFEVFHSIQGIKMLRTFQTIELTKRSYFKNPYFPLTILLIYANS